MKGLKAASVAQLEFLGGIRLTDNELTAQLKSGDENVIYIISDRFSGYVMTVIRNFSGGALSPQDMEELCSDVFSGSGSTETVSTRASG